MRLDYECKRLWDGFFRFLRLKAEFSRILWVYAAIHHKISAASSTAEMTPNITPAFAKPL